MVGRGLGTDIFGGEDGKIPKAGHIVVCNNGPLTLFSG